MVTPPPTVNDCANMKKWSFKTMIDLKQFTTGVYMEHLQMYVKPYKQSIMWDDIRVASGSFWPPFFFCI